MKTIIPHLARFVPAPPPKSPIKQGEIVGCRRPFRVESIPSNADLTTIETGVRHVFNGLPLIEKSATGGTMGRTVRTPVGLKATPTNGILFDDGNAIDRLRDRSLVIYHKGNILQGTTVEYMGSNYEAAPLGPNLEALIRFAASADEFSTPYEFLSDLESAIQNGIGFDANNALLLAFSVMRTYFPECLPTTPIINLYGPLGAETRAIQVLSCLCRRPLHLADASAKEALRLPADLCPTLIFRSSNPEKLASLLAIVSNAGAILRDGEALSFRWPVVIATTEPLHLPALRIPVTHAMPFGRLLPSEAEMLVNAFQGKLLKFRLQRHREVSQSRFDVPGFAPETRLLAAALGPVMEGFPAAQARLIDALKAMDEDEKEESAQLPATTVLQVLLAACHTDEAQISNKEVTRRSNSLLVARSERLQLSAKEVGGIMRRELGLLQKRESLGFELRLDNSAIGRIHRLAESFGAQSRLKPFMGCAFCTGLLPGKQIPADVHEVHNVHSKKGKK